jgi:hypothetical protein
MSKTNESRIAEGACKRLVDFEEKVDKYYVKRLGKKKLETEEGEESEALCDIIEAINDKKVLAWPATIGAKKIAIVLKYKEDENILETWGDILKGLEDFCKNNKLLKPIKVIRFEKEHRFLRVFVDKYKNLTALLSRLYLYRKGKYGDIRCAIHVSLEDKKIWLWPVVDTPNLIVVCLEAENLIEQWKLILTDIERRARENGVDFDRWDYFTPPN